MREVGERIDDRNARVLGELLDDTVSEGAHHDQVAHPAQHLGHVPETLAPVLAHLGGAEIHDVPAQLVHAGGERDPRAERGLVEYQRRGAAGERARGWSRLAAGRPGAARPQPVRVLE